MNSFGPEQPPDPAAEPPDDAAPTPFAPTVPTRVTIHTGPPAPATAPPQPGQWLQDQPYGASPHAPYAVAAARRSHRWRQLLLPLLVLALVGGAGAVLFRDRLFGDDQPAHPSEWDPRVADLVEFVQTARELQWVHPVYVDFLAEAEFVALFDQPQGNQAADATAGLYSQLYDAFGLAVGYDPTQGDATVSAITTLGFYSPADDRVYVRGDLITPAVRVVLAHELTHALQAQHFDLAGDGADDLELRAVVEADALRVEDAFRATLSAADRVAADDGNSHAPEAAAGLAAVPRALLEQRDAPYVLGPMLVGDVFAAAGNAGIDELIGTPPTEEILLNPWLHGTEQQDAAVTLEVPVGTIVLDPPQPLSAVAMLVMLDAWLPWRQARGALDGWAGGGYTSYQRDGVVCFTATATFDDSGTPFANAVAAWATASGSAATPTTVVNDVTFEACKRAVGATAPPPPVVSPMQALSLEHDVIALAGDGPSLAQIREYQCLAGTMIDDPLLAPLLFNEILNDAEQALFTWQSTIAANECGVPPLTQRP